MGRSVNNKALYCFAQTIKAKCNCEILICLSHHFHCAVVLHSRKQFAARVQSFYFL